MGTGTRHGTAIPSRAAGVTVKTPQAAGQRDYGAEQDEALSLWATALDVSRETRERGRVHTNDRQEA